MKKINVTFVETAVLDDLRAGTPLEEKYEEGKAYSLDPHTAVRWVRRNKALFDSQGDAEAAHQQTGWSAPDTILAAGTKKAEPQAKSGDDDDDLDKLTRAQLDALAAKRGIDISAAKTKADVIKLLSGDGSSDDDDLDKLTDDELKALAYERKVDFSGVKSREEALAALQAAK